MKVVLLVLVIVVSVACGASSPPSAATPAAKAVSSAPTCTIRNAAYDPPASQTSRTTVTGPTALELCARWKANSGSRDAKPLAFVICHSSQEGNEITITAATADDSWAKQACLYNSTP